MNSVSQILQDVLGNVHQHRSRTSRARDVERFLYGRSDVLDLHHEEVVLGDGQGYAGNIGFLKGIAADGGAGHLSGDCHQGHGVHLGRGDSSNEICGPGAAGGRADANAARGAGVAVCGHGGGLLVPHQHVAQLRIPGHGAIQWQHRSAREPEHYVDSLLE